MTEVRFEYPLQWLPQQPRTKYPQTSRFGNHSPHSAGWELTNELKLLQAKNIIISSNLKVRKDGTGFYSKQNVQDPGIVVYFDLKGAGKAIACDRWRHVADNIRALCLSIRAIRGLERWGGSEFLDGLFTGFKALPSPDMVIQAQRDYFLGMITPGEIHKRYLELCKEHHPDMGGDAETFAEVQRQYEVKKSLK
jgi:hypothetical protein